MKWAMLAWTALFIGIMAASMYQRNQPANVERMSSCSMCDTSY